MKPATLKPIKTFDYLDKGFVELLDVHLTDTDSALLARSSFNKEEYSDEERNRSLVRYLIREAHTSPLEMGSITVRIKMPIFVMRQHVRHRTAKLNEQSLRYVTHDGDYHIPWGIRKSAKNVKQGSSGDIIENNEELKAEWAALHEQAYALYLRSLEMGAAKEQARGLLGTSFYTVVVWQMDLSNLLKYMGLRSDPHAQKEIQDLSKIFEQIVEEYFPEIYKAWRNYHFESLKFSMTELSLIRIITKYGFDEDVSTPEGMQRAADRMIELRDAAFDPPEELVLHQKMSESEFQAFCSKVEMMFGIIL